ncbi:MAG: thioesterase family protein [Thermoplasmatales archaeon]|jgi:acyl-CoA thioester hydrolase|nr:acyl-CoA thioesterase [Candidatus Thermoplasmatota archaeon]MCL6002898.1 acyl-CoA thioesterase [Candidatus Thermoplasmatota archaeon]MDA8056264.1 thioesterase family protein [Thermoplasmatales archaeon]
MVLRADKNPFNYEYVISWADTDALGIMHFSNYFRLCERAEQFYFDSKKLSENTTLFLPRVHSSCDFSYPLRFKQKARVELVLKEIGNRHMSFDFSIMNESEHRLSARCQIVVASVNEKMEPTNIGEEIVRKLTEG